MEGNDYQLLLNRVAKLENEVEELKKRDMKMEGISSTGRAGKSIQSGVADQGMKEQSPDAFVKNPFKVSVALKSPPKKINYTPAPKKEVEWDFELLLGTWLPRLFMVILLFGVLWGLKVGMDNGIITNPVRIALGYAASMGLAFIGFRYYKVKNKAFGLTLLGGFIAVGIITTFAAHNLYGYFNPYVAFGISLLYAVAGFVLSKKTNSEALMLFSTFAAFLLPFLLEGSGASALLFVGYVLLLFLFSFQFSLLQGYKYTYYFTFALFHLTYLSYNVLTWTNVDDMWFVAAVITAHLYILGLFLSGKVAKGIFSEILLYTNFVFAMAWVQTLATDYATQIYAGITGLYLLTTIWAFKQSVDLTRGILTAISVFAAGMLILSFDFQNDNTRLLLLLLDGTVGLWVGMQYKSLRTLTVSGFIYGITAFTILSGMSFNLLWSLEHSVWLSLIATLAVIYYAGYKYLPTHFKITIKQMDVSLIVGQVIFMIYLIDLVPVLNGLFAWPYAIVEHVMILVLIVSLSGLYFLYKWNHGRYIAYAVVVEFLILGTETFSKHITHYESDMFGFNLGVEVLYVSLLSYLFVTVWKKTTFLPDKIGADKLAILMQVIYFLFLNKWYFETTDYFIISSDYTYLIHTLLLLGFAFVSISVGRKHAWKHVKILGALLILVCVMKLFFVDLINVSLFIRAILFIIVGSVGLIYSRSFFSKK